MNPTKSDSCQQRLKINQREINLEDPDIINWNLNELLDSDECELLGSDDFIEEVIA